ncbi:4Fe-4S dicluster domain-containing protein [Chloroflexota bacterium]
MQLGLYFDQTRCTGCGACQVACKDWYDIPAGPESWLRLTYTEEGRFPDVFVSYMVMTCYQCQDPVCVKACPASAIKKRDEDGIVIVDTEACLGNKECNEKCRIACPYDAPQFANEVGAKMRKCQFCIERWQENKLPICVEACPTRALDAGPIELMMTKYSGEKDTSGFKYSDRVNPAIVLRPKLK